MEEESSSELPCISKPASPRLTQHGEGKVLVTCTIPQARGTEVKEVEILYKESQKKNFRSKSIFIPQTETVISNLTVDVEYTFKIQGKNLDDDVVSDSSDTSQIKITVCNTNNPTVPGRPFLWRTEGSHSISLRWNPPETSQGNISRYEIFVFQEGHDAYSLYSDTNHLIIENLKQMCSYKFNVRAELQMGMEVTYSDLSEESEEIKTEISIGTFLKDHKDTKCEKAQMKPRMSLHKLKCYQYGKVDHANKIRHVRVGQGEEMDHTGNTRYILLFGQTGAGKSTIIDLIVNHIYDVAWQDEFRLKAVDLMEDEENKDQTESQTQWITCYEMKQRKNSLLDFDLVVIDTPGFNALQKKGNSDVKRQFQTLILEKRIPGLHAICFVAHSHTGRLTENEKILSKMISDLFGKDIKESIFIFATCADSSRPLVGFVLRNLGVTYHEIFKFNNTPFTFEKLMSRADEQRQHWNEGKDSILSFFDKLEDLHLKSLKLPDETIKALEIFNSNLKTKRQKADDAIYGVLNILSNVVHYEKKMQGTPRKRNATVCKECQINCCYPCNMSWINKRLCWNMEFFGGKCVNCKCKVSDHASGPFIYEQSPTIKEKEKKDNEVDPHVLSEMKDQISSAGRFLTDYLLEVHDIRKSIDHILDRQMESSINDTIDSFIKEKRSKSVLQLPLIEMILKKCKNDAGKPREERWDDLKDFE